MNHQIATLTSEIMENTHETNSYVGNTYWEMNEEQCIDLLKTMVPGFSMIDKETFVNLEDNYLVIEQAIQYIKQLSFALGRH
jgi:hypothetical protein